MLPCNISFQDGQNLIMRAHSGEGDHGFRRMAAIWSGRWRPGRRM